MTHTNSDFPGEVFLQKPRIIESLLDLLQISGSDENDDLILCRQATSCLQVIIKHTNPEETFLP